MANNTSNRGFRSMDPDKQRSIASMGGSASGGNFARNKKRASEMGKLGNAAQSTAAKRLGGQHSHRNG